MLKYQTTEHYTKSSVTNFWNIKTGIRTKNEFLRLSYIYIILNGTK